VLDEERTEWGEVLKLRPEDLNDRWSLTNMGLTVLPPGLHKQLSQKSDRADLDEESPARDTGKRLEGASNTERSCPKGHNPPNSIDAEATTRAPQSLSIKT
jgi:hypothetical protein